MLGWREGVVTTDIGHMILVVLSGLLAAVIGRLTLERVRPLLNEFVPRVHSGVRGLVVPEVILDGYIVEAFVDARASARIV